MADLNLNVTESIAIKPSELISALAKTTPSTLVEYLIAGETIFPSGYDIAGVPGDGIIMRERSLSDNWLKLLTNNFTFSGLVIPGSSVNFNITIPLGIACIAGRYLSIPATTVTCSPSTTSYIFLKVSRDANLNVTGAWYEVNTTGTPPVDATPIATAITSGSAITSTTDARLLGPQGVITITSGTSWIVKAGLTRIFVEVIGASGGGGGGGEGSATGADGGTGGAGGTTTFDVLTTTGGALGGRGDGGASALIGSTAAAHGVGSGGQINLTGRGQPGGPGGGGGGGNGGATVGDRGGTGGDGGYSAGFLNVTPGTSITIAIGAAGTAGAGGTGGAGIDGGAGRVGLAGMILVHY